MGREKSRMNEKERNTLCTSIKGTRTDHEGAKSKKKIKKFSYKKKKKNSPILNILRGVETDKGLKGRLNERAGQNSW